MGKLDRLDYKTAIPQLEKAIEAVSKETENVDIKVNAASATVAEVDKTARTANIAAQSAEQSATAAQTAAENAQTSATAAQTAAESAQASAETAETKATQAITDAANAKTAADNAQDSADSAASAAQTADSKATQASADAQTASTAAQSAQTSATQALSQAQTASTAAAEAKSDAQTAKTQAQAASTAASAAQTSADNAATAAATADAKAQQAIADAGRAQTAASTAETSAAQAISDAAAANTAANNAGRAASIAQAAAEAAQGDIDEQQTYFWHDSEGAHVLGDTYRTDVKDGLKVVRNSDGSVLADIKADGATFKSGSGQQIAHLGYGQTESSGGTVNAAFYDLGTRNPNHDVGSFSVIEGENTAASRDCTHAEGKNTIASADYSHAEGQGTVASEKWSHAEGVGNIAGGAASHAEGYYNEIAKSDNPVLDPWNTGSHVEGLHNIAQMERDMPQHVEGRWNKPDSNSILAHIVGGGTSENDRRNIHTLDYNGNACFKGNLRVQATDAECTVGTLVSVEGHNHNTAYYTKAEIETALNGKADANHNHDSRYYTKTEIANHIAEKGTVTAGSATWKYRKWSDGTLEMWGSATTTLAISTASGAIYTTASDYDIAMPAFVDAVDFITAELSGGGWADVTSFNTPPKLRLYAPTSYSSASRTLKYYMKGTWK